MALTKWSRVRYGNDVYGRPVTIDRRLSRMLDELARLLHITRVPIAQGGFMGGQVSASAGAHDGPGVVDLSVTGLRRLGVRDSEVLRCARLIGLVLWHRYPSQGPWPEHYHGVALGTKGLPLVAAQQLTAWLAGYNGLGHLGRGGPDDAPRPDVIRTWEQYKAWRDRTVSVADVQAAHDRDPQRVDGLHPRQTRTVQRALGMRVRTGRWRAGTREKYAERFPLTKGRPTRGSLERLSAGTFPVVD